MIFFRTEKVQLHQVLMNLENGFPIHKSKIAITYSSLHLLTVKLFDYDSFSAVNTFNKI